MKRKILMLGLFASMILASCGTNTSEPSVDSNDSSITSNETVTSGESSKGDTTSNQPSSNNSSSNDSSSNNSSSNDNSSSNSSSSNNSSNEGSHDQQATIKTLDIDFNDKSQNNVLPTEPQDKDVTFGDVKFGLHQAFKLTSRDGSTDYLILRGNEGCDGSISCKTNLGRIRSIEIQTTTFCSATAKVTIYASNDASFTNATKIYDEAPGVGATKTIDFTGKKYAFFKIINENPIRDSKGKDIHKSIQLANLKVVYQTDNLDTEVEIPGTEDSSHGNETGPDINVDLSEQTQASKNYYQGFNFDLTGDDLRDSLNALIRSKRKRNNSYDDLRTLSPKINCPIGQEGTIYVFYKGTTARVGCPMSFSGDYNREHTWPNSRGAGKSGIGSDPFMLQPTLKSDNSSRGNDFYTNPGEGGWTPSDDRYKGDCARLIMYGYTHYFNINHLKISDAGNESTSNHSMGKISTLLEWHFKYPANNWEKERNENGDKVIGLRNPFVDFPELAAKEFKNFNANTRKVCEKYGY